MQLLSAVLVYAQLLLLGRFSWPWDVCIFTDVNQEVSQWTEKCHLSVKIIRDYVQLQSAIRTPQIPAGTGIHICILAFHRRDKERWKKKLGWRGLAGQLHGD